MTLSMLQEPTLESKVETLGDLPLIVVANVTIHWGRIDRDFEMKAWCWDNQPTSPRVGNTKYHIGFNAKKAEPFIQITREHEPTKTQTTWQLEVADIKVNGTRARLTEI